MLAVEKRVTSPLLVRARANRGVGWGGVQAGVAAGREGGRDGTRAGRHDLEESGWDPGSCQLAALGALHKGGHSRRTDQTHHS